MTTLADDRKDALFFVDGGLLGALVYGSIQDTRLFNKIAGGKDLHIYSEIKNEA